MLTCRGTGTSIEIVHREILNEVRSSSKRSPMYYPDLGADLVHANPEFVRPRSGCSGMRFGIVSKFSCKQ